MDKKDQRPSVPIGTFRTSSVPDQAPIPPVPPGGQTLKPPPPVPAAATRAIPRDDETVQTRAVRNSRPPGPPPEGEPERKRVRTLVGVPTPPPGALSAAGKGLYPSPPKWKKPSERDDEPTVREMISVPVARIELKPASNRPSPPAPAVAADGNISDTIQQMLDEQTSVTMEIEDAPPEFAHVPGAPPPPATARRSSNPPVMLPAHIAAAHAQETEQVQDQISRRSSAPPDELFKPWASPLMDLSGSSLAPAEVPGVKHRDDRAPAFGFAFVAAMAALFVGGWFATAGGYQPPKHPELALARAAKPPNAAAAQSAAAPEPPKVVVPPAPAPIPAPAAQAVPDQETGAPASVAIAPAPAPRPTAKAPAVAAAARVVRSAPVTRAAAPREAAPIVRITKVEQEAPTPAPTEAVAPVAPPVEENLPDSPRREDVLARIESLRSVVTACAESKKGVAELDITIAGSGAITTVLVGGDFAGTPQGSCIARSVRQARFPKFKKERFRLLYPFSI